MEPNFCPPYEGPAYKKEGPPSKQGGATFIKRRVHTSYKGGDLTPTGTEELKSTASMVVVYSSELSFVCEIIQ